MSAPRKDARDGGVKRQGGKSKYGGTNGWSSKREVGGRGMYVTCVRGREKNCANDILDLLVEVSPSAAVHLELVLMRRCVQTAAKLYPAERLAALAVVAAELQAQYAALRAIKEAAAGQAPMETAEDGTPEEENSDDEDDEDEDIETSIARELAEIRAAKGSQFSLRRAPKTEDQDKGKVKDKAPRAPFIPVFTAIDCCE
jgi:tRNA acetyltransferase TAN1